jgi:hypothetical protein
LRISIEDFIKSLIILFLVLFLFDANAEIIVGSGFNSITGGRPSPTLYTGYDSSSFAVTANAVGVKTKIYYHSGYVVSAFSQKEMGDFWWGKLRAGFGGGIHYAQRQYVDGAVNETKSDFALGPAMRVTWEIFPFGFIGVDELYGIRSLETLVLSTQNIISLIFGVRF